MIRPINKGILLEELENKENKTAGGIIIQSSKVDSGKFVKQCKVLATDTDTIKIGDKVIVDAYGPQQVNFNPIQYIAKESHILAVVED